MEMIKNYRLSGDFIHIDHTSSHVKETNSEHSLLTTSISYLSFVGTLQPQCGTKPELLPKAHNVIRMPKYPLLSMMCSCCYSASVCLLKSSTRNNNWYLIITTARNNSTMMYALSIHHRTHYPSTISSASEHFPTK